MADIIIYGSPLSTYTRTARMALEEKGVPYRLEEVAPGSPDSQEVHPFGRVPAMRHGDFTLFETMAIARYADEAFDGPALQPGDVQMRAIMNQWISSTIDYFFPSMVRNLVIERLVAPARGRQTDEAKIRETLPDVENQLLVLSGALQDHLYLAGDTATLADLFVLPILFYVNFTPEGRKLIGQSPRILRWLETMAKRPSEKATLPPLEGLKPE